ncbi:hypothetical protein TRFO_37881 [Tritrichomonas foetus]|uniref:Uncharacterized protein n=1 Tax=Tritrichomonas foetus TaxID=1144522 RepID=A0A1J4J9W5_9EUKA|nr:hypothetical protein TRFO_37881 [Tritrichomonas foetus]|eukprot:OHS95982.1 hypothetical protein TRFO_37881 [Tritrichomonas foetus]
MSKLSRYKVKNPQKFIDYLKALNMQASCIVKCSTVSSKNNIRKYAMTLTGNSIVFLRFKSVKSGISILRTIPILKIQSITFKDRFYHIQTKDNDVFKIQTKHFDFFYHDLRYYFDRLQFSFLKNRDIIIDGFKPAKTTVVTSQPPNVTLLRYEAEVANYSGELSLKLGRNYYDYEASPHCYFNFLNIKEPIIHPNILSSPLIAEKQLSVLDFDGIAPKIVCKAIRTFLKYCKSLTTIIMQNYQDFQFEQFCFETINNPTVVSWTFKNCFTQKATKKRVPLFFNEFKNYSKDIQSFHIDGFILDKDSIQNFTCMLQSKHFRTIEFLIMRNIDLPHKNPLFIYMRIIECLKNLFALFAFEFTNPKKKIVFTDEVIGDYLKMRKEELEKEEKELNALVSENLGKLDQKDLHENDQNSDLSKHRRKHKSSKTKKSLMRNKLLQELVQKKELFAFVQLNSLKSYKISNFDYSHLAKTIKIPSSLINLEMNDTTFSYDSFIYFLNEISNHENKLCLSLENYKIDKKDEKKLIKYLKKQQEPLKNLIEVNWSGNEISEKFASVFCKIFLPVQSIQCFQYNNSLTVNTIPAFSIICKHLQNSRLWGLDISGGSDPKNRLGVDIVRVLHDVSLLSTLEHLDISSHGIDDKTIVTVITILKDSLKMLHEISIDDTSLSSRTALYSVYRHLFTNLALKSCQRPLVDIHRILPADEPGQERFQKFRSKMQTTKIPSTRMSRVAFYHHSLDIFAKFQSFYQNYPASITVDYPSHPLWLTLLDPTAAAVRSVYSESVDRITVNFAQHQSDCIPSPYKNPPIPPPKTEFKTPELLESYKEFAPKDIEDLSTEIVDTSIETIGPNLVLNRYKALIKPSFPNMMVNIDIIASIINKQADGQKDAYRTTTRVARPSEYVSREAIRLFRTKAIELLAKTSDTSLNSLNIPSGSYAGRSEFETSNKSTGINSRLISREIMNTTSDLDDVAEMMQMMNSRYKNPEKEEKTSPKEEPAPQQEIKGTISTVAIHLPSLPEVQELPQVIDKTKVRTYDVLMMIGMTKGLDRTSISCLNKIRSVGQTLFNYGEPEDSDVTVVPLPKDPMKIRILSRALPSYLQNIASNYGNFEESTPPKFEIIPPTVTPQKVQKPQSQPNLNNSPSIQMKENYHDFDLSLPSPPKKNPSVLPFNSPSSAPTPLSTILGPNSSLPTKSLQLVPLTTVGSLLVTGSDQISETEKPHSNQQDKSAETLPDPKQTKISLSLQETKNEQPPKKEKPKPKEEAPKPIKIQISQKSSSSSDDESESSSSASSSFSSSSSRSSSPSSSSEKVKKEEIKPAKKQTPVKVIKIEQEKINKEAIKEAIKATNRELAQADANQANTESRSSQKENVKNPKYNSLITQPVAKSRLIIEKPTKNILKDKNSPPSRKERVRFSIDNTMILGPTKDQGTIKKEREMQKLPPPITPAPPKVESQNDTRNKAFVIPQPLALKKPTDHQTIIIPPALLVPPAIRPPQFSLQHPIEINREIPLLPKQSPTAKLSLDNQIPVPKRRAVSDLELPEKVIPKERTISDYSDSSVSLKGQIKKPLLKMVSKPNKQQIIMQPPLLATPKDFPPPMIPPRLV